MSLPYLVQPPKDEPFKLAIIGISTFSLALRICSKYSSGPIRKLIDSGK